MSLTQCIADGKWICAPGASDVICERYFVFDNDQPAQANCKLSEFVRSQFPAHAHAGGYPWPYWPGRLRWHCCPFERKYVINLMSVRNGNMLFIPLHKRSCSVLKCVVIIPSGIRWKFWHLFFFFPQRTLDRDQFFEKKWSWSRLFSLCSHGVSSHWTYLDFVNRLLKISVSAQREFTEWYYSLLSPAKNTDLDSSEGPLLEFEMEAWKRERCRIAAGECIDGWFKISEGLQSTILEFTHTIANQHITGL